MSTSSARNVFFISLLMAFTATILYSEDDAEPGNNAFDGTQVVNLSSGQVSSHSVPPEDVDWFKFSLPSSAVVQIETFTGTDDFQPSTDTVITLCDDAGVSLGIEDDNSGEQYLFSRLTHPLSAGDYTIRVSNGGNNNRGSSYVYCIRWSTVPDINLNINVNSLSATIATWGDDYPIIVDLVLSQTQTNPIPENDVVTLCALVWDDKDSTWWESSKVYSIDDYVLYREYWYEDGRFDMYRCQTDHTSTGSFNDDRWNGYWQNEDYNRLTTKRQLSSDEVAALNATGSLSETVLPIHLLGGSNPWVLLSRTRVDIEVWIETQSTINTGSQVNDREADYLWVDPAFELKVSEIDYVWGYAGLPIDFDLTVSLVSGSIPEGSIVLTALMQQQLNEPIYTILTQTQIDDLNTVGHLDLTLTLPADRLWMGFYGLNESMMGVATGQVAWPAMTSFAILPPQSIQVGPMYDNTNISSVDPDDSGSAYFLFSGVDLTADGLQTGFVGYLFGSPNDAGRFCDNSQNIQTLSATAVRFFGTLSGSVVLTGADLANVHFTAFDPVDLSITGAPVWPSVVNLDANNYVDLVIRKNSAVLFDGTENVSVEVELDYAQGGSDYKSVGYYSLPDPSQLNSGDVAVSVPFFVPSQLWGMETTVVHLRLRQWSNAGYGSTDIYHTPSIGTAQDVFFTDFRTPLTVDISKGALVGADMMSLLPTMTQPGMNIQLNLTLESSSRPTIHIDNRQYGSTQGMDTWPTPVEFEVYSDQFSMSDTGVYDIGWVLSLNAEYYDYNQGTVNVSYSVVVSGPVTVTLPPATAAFDVGIVGLSSTDVIDGTELISIGVELALSATSPLCPDNAIIAVVVTAFDGPRSGQNSVRILTLPQIRVLNAGGSVFFNEIMPVSGATGPVTIQAVLTVLENGIDTNSENNWMAKTLIVNPVCDIYPEAILSAPLGTVRTGDTATVVIRVRKTGGDASVLLRPMIAYGTSNNEQGGNFTGYFSIGEPGVPTQLSEDQIIELNATGSVDITLTGPVLALVPTGITQIQAFAYMDFVPGDSNRFNNTLQPGEWITILPGTDVGIASAVTVPLNNPTPGSISVNVELSHSGPDINKTFGVTVSIFWSGNNSNDSYSLGAYRLSDADIDVLNSTSSTLVMVPVSLYALEGSEVRFRAQVEYTLDSNWANNSVETNSFTVGVAPDLMLTDVSVPSVLTAGKPELVTVTIELDPLRPSLSVSTDAILRLRCYPGYGRDYIDLRPDYRLSTTEIQTLNATNALSLDLIVSAGPTMNGLPLEVVIECASDAIQGNNIYRTALLSVIGVGCDLALDVVYAPTGVAVGADYTAVYRISLLTGEEPDPNSVISVFNGMMGDSGNSDEKGDNEVKYGITLSVTQISTLVLAGYVDIPVVIPWSLIQTSRINSYDSMRWLLIAQLGYSADTNPVNNGFFYIATVTLLDYQFTQPTVGQIVDIGSVMELAWIVRGWGEPVRLEISRNGLAGPWTVVNPLVLQVLTYQWSVSGPETTNAMFRIGNLAGDAYIYSPVFTIQAGTNYIILTTPNGGETFADGQTMPIAWDTTYSGSETVKIEISGDNFNSQIYEITSLTVPASSLSYDYIIDAADLAGTGIAIPSSQLRARISVDGSAATDRSDGLFSITTQPVATMTVSPLTLSLTIVAGSSGIIEKDITVSVSSGIGIVVWSATTSAPWLSVLPATGIQTGGTNAVVSARFNPDGLTVGSHTASITFTAPGQTSQTVSVVVNVFGIEVVHPNGGERLNGVIRVSWTPLNESVWPAGSTVDAALYQSGLFVVSIASGLELSETGVDFDTSLVPDGAAYRVRLAGNATDQSDSAFIIDNHPPVILLVSSAYPADSAVNLSLSTTVSATVAASDLFLDPNAYVLDVSTDMTFSTAVQSTGWVASPDLEINPVLALNTTYYWRVGVRDTTGNVSYHSTSSFTTWDEIIVSAQVVSGNGSITPNGSLLRHTGDSISFAILPDLSWSILSITENGTIISNTSTLTYIDLTSDIVIEVSFAPIGSTIHTVMATAGIGGSILPAGDVSVIDGDDQSFSIVADPHYTIFYVAVDGVSVGAISTYTFTNVTEFHTIHAVFAIDTFTITASMGAGGSLSPSGVSIVYYSDSLTINITPNIGMVIDDVLVDGISVGAVASYSFNSVDANHTLSASFKVATFVIDATADAGGSIDPSGSIIVSYGDDQTFAMTPNAGYHIADVLADSVSVGAVASYTFSNVTASHTVSASFAINTYTITATAGANGSVSPSGVSVVNYGDSLSVTITPNTGYVTLDVVVDGAVHLGGVASYSFVSVTENHTIEATFIEETVNLYSINASAGANGTIDPSGVLILTEGGSQTFTITPDANYHIANVLADGISAGAVTSYTFTNVTASHSISAVFTIDTYAITTSAGIGGSVSPTGAVFVNYGEDQTFAIVADTGYHIADVVVDALSVSAVASYTFSNVTTSHSISAVFAINTFTISTTAGSNGSVSPSGATIVNYNESLAVSIIPNAGFAVGDVLVDGVSVGAVTTYSFSAITANHTLSAQFVVAPVVEENKAKTIFDCSISGRSTAQPWTAIVIVFAGLIFAAGRSRLSTRTTVFAFVAFASASLFAENAGEVLDTIDNTVSDDFDMGVDATPVGDYIPEVKDDPVSETSKTDSAPTLDSSLTAVVLPIDEMPTVSIPTKAPSLREYAEIKMIPNHLGLSVGRANSSGGNGVELEYVPFMLGRYFPSSVFIGLGSGGESFGWAFGARGYVYLDPLSVHDLFETYGFVQIDYASWIATPDAQNAFNESKEEDAPGVEIAVGARALFYRRFGITGYIGYGFCSMPDWHNDNDKPGYATAGLLFNVAIL